MQTAFVMQRTVSETNRESRRGVSFSVIFIVFRDQNRLENINMTSILQQEAKVIDLPMVAKQRTMDIVTEIRVNMDGRLDHLFDGLGENVADALFEEMWGLDEQDALEHHFNVMRALKLQSDVYRG